MQTQETGSASKPVYYFRFRQCAGPVPYSNTRLILVARGRRFIEHIQKVNFRPSY
jgi:hypothetical protein